MTIEIIDGESKADKDGLDWCNAERESNDEKQKDQIGMTKDSLEKNHHAQVEKIQERSEVNGLTMKSLSHKVDIQKKSEFCPEDGEVSEHGRAESESAEGEGARRA